MRFTLVFITLACTVSHVTSQIDPNAAADTLAGLMGGIMGGGGGIMGGDMGGAMGGGPIGAGGHGGGPIDCTGILCSPPICPPGVETVLLPGECCAGCQVDTVATAEFTKEDIQAMLLGMQGGQSYNLQGQPAGFGEQVLLVGTLNTLLAELEAASDSATSAAASSAVGDVTGVSGGEASNMVDINPFPGGVISTGPAADAGTIFIPAPSDASVQPVAPETLPVDVAPVDVAPADVAPGDVAPVDVAPVDVAPVDVAPVDVAPVDVAPVDVAPVDVAPVDVAPVDVAPGDVAPVDVAPVDVAPVDVAPVDVAPVDVAPVDVAPVDVAPVDVAPVDVAPVDVAPVDVAPVDVAPVDVAPVDVAPVDVAPVDVAPVDVAPVDVAPVDVAPVDVAPVDVAPVDVEPVDVAPVDVAPVDAAPVDVAPVDVAPVDVAPVAPVDVAPVDVAPVAPVDVAPVDVAPVVVAPVDVAPVDVTPVDVAPVDVAPVDVAPVDVAPVDVAPVDVAPVDVAPVDVAPVDVSPVDVATVDVAPVDVAPVDVAPVDVAPVDVAPVDVAPVDVAPVDVSPVDVAPIDVAPVDVAPVDVSPVDVAPVDVAPVDIAPVDVAPVGVAPVDVAPVDVAPVHVAPVDVAPVAVPPVATPDNSAIGSPSPDTVPIGPETPVISSAGITFGDQSGSATLPQTDFFKNAALPLITEGGPEWLKARVDPAPCQKWKCNQAICYVPHKNDCKSYIVCQRTAIGSYVAWKMRCAFGSFWGSGKTWTCERVEDLVGQGYTCPNDPCQNSNTLTTYPDEDKRNCRTYWKCENGMSKPMCCPPGMQFDKTTLKCENDPQDICRSPCPLKIEGCSQPGARTQPFYDGNCLTYWDCENGHPHPVCCPAGMSYYSETGGCIDEPMCKATCPPEYIGNVCGKVAGEGIVTSYALTDGNCRTYMKCNPQGYDEAYCCRQEHFYDAATGECQRIADQSDPCNVEICPSTYKEECRFTAVSNPTQFFDTDAGLVRDCAPSTTFAENICTCDGSSLVKIQSEIIGNPQGGLYFTKLGRNTIRLITPDQRGNMLRRVSNPCKKEVWARFDQLQDKWSVKNYGDGWISVFGDMTKNQTDQGVTYGTFDGSSGMEVWRYDHTTLPEVSLDITFQPVSSGNGRQILVSNCMSVDNSAEPSFEVALNPQTSTVEIIGKSRFNSAQLSIPYNAQGWNRLRLYYDGQTFVGAVADPTNATPQTVKSANLRGEITAGIGALKFGPCLDSFSMPMKDGFTGFVSEVSFSKCLDSAGIDFIRANV